MYESVFDHFGAIQVFGGSCLNFSIFTRWLLVKIKKMCLGAWEWPKWTFWGPSTPQGTLFDHSRPLDWTFWGLRKMAKSGTSSWPRLVPQPPHGYKSCSLIVWSRFPYPTAEYYHVHPPILCMYHHTNGFLPYYRAAIILVCIALL